VVRRAEALRTTLPLARLIPDHEAIQAWNTHVEEALEVERKGG
jgi:hypothetical protein